MENVTSESKENEQQQQQQKVEKRKIPLTTKEKWKSGEISLTTTTKQKWKSGEIFTKPTKHVKLKQSIIETLFLSRNSCVLENLVEITITGSLQTPKDAENI